MVERIIGIVEKPIRYKNLDNDAPKEINLNQPRQVRILVTRDDETDDVRYYSINSLPENIHEHDFPKLAFKDLEKEIDIVDVKGTSLPNVLRKGSSITHYDIDNLIRERGGDPDYKIPKPDSSFALNRDQKDEE